MADQFTRWLCAKCDRAGIDSWNKAMFDGVDHGDSPLPNPWTLGMECVCCGWPCVVRYTDPDTAPRAIFGPIAIAEGAYAYEPAAFEAIELAPDEAIALTPSETRDADWSRGCLSVRAQLQ